MPIEYKKNKGKIICNDCKRKFTSMDNFLYHDCLGNEDKTMRDIENE